MDLNIYYPFLSVQNTDLLLQNRNDLIGLGRALNAILGTTTQFNELACVAHTPPNLTVDVNGGEIYSLQQVSPGTYGGAEGLALDTTQIIKQGILLDTVNLSCPAPATVGFSIDYLVQVAFQETDTDPQDRGYYNPAAIPPNFTQILNMLRADTALVTVKAGVAATTGTQVPPSPDAGYTGAYVVTVAEGQTTITSGNIAVYPDAPFLTEKLKDKLGQAAADLLYAKISQVKYCTGIVNGGMTIAQREPFDLTGATLGIGLVDTMMGQVTGTTVTAGTLTQGSGLSFGQTGYSTRFSSVTTTGSGVATFIHRMESNDAVNYKNQIASLSGLVSHNVGSNVNYQITVSKANAKNNFGAITQISQGSATPISTGVPTTISLANISMGDCSNGIEIKITAAIGAVTTKTLDVTDLFLNTGATVFPFIPQDETVERMRCLRRYEKSYEDGQLIGTITTADCVSLVSSAVGSIAIAWPYKTPKIFSPTFTIYSAQTGTAGFMGSGGGDAAASTSSGLNVFNASISAATASTEYNFNFQAIADL